MCSSGFSFVLSLLSDFKCLQFTRGPFWCSSKTQHYASYIANWCVRGLALMPQENPVNWNCFKFVREHMGFPQKQLKLLFSKETFPLRALLPRQLTQFALCESARIRGRWRTLQWSHWSWSVRKALERCVSILLLKELCFLCFASFWVPAQVPVARARGEGPSPISHIKIWSRCLVIKCS